LVWESDLVWIWFLLIENITNGFYLDTHRHTSLNVETPISVAPRPTSPSYENLKTEALKDGNCKPNKAMQQSKEVSHMRFVGDSELLGVVGRWGGT
jgi:hypothetical protein